MTDPDAAFVHSWRGRFWQVIEQGNVRRCICLSARSTPRLAAAERRYKEELMHSDLIGKIEKALRYAQEPERVSLDEIQARFHGGNNEHMITLSEGRWTCDCEFFRVRRTCAHVMAMQKIFEQMLSPEARAVDEPIASEQIVGSVS